LPNIFSILIMTEFDIENIANDFIALVNCIDVKTQKISCADQILTALGASGIGLLWTTGLHWYKTLLNPALYSSEVRTIAYIAWIVSSHFSVWLATSLSILYLLKIANFSSPFFLHLKWKAERVVLMILLETVLLVSHIVVVGVDGNMRLNEYKGNITWKINMRHIVHLSNITVFTLANSILLTMFMTTFLLQIFSQWKYFKNMQLSGKGTQDVSTNIHVRAMQTELSFFLLFVIYFLAQIISLLSSGAAYASPPPWLPQLLPSMAVLHVPTQIVSEVAPASAAAKGWPTQQGGLRVSLDLHSDCCGLHLYGQALEQPLRPPPLSSGPPLPPRAGSHYRWGHRRALRCRTIFAVPLPLLG
ncbi:LOW QUALITY PROTEIN: taste receptor type 2 member 50-like, partial [Rhynchonycteris naso]